MLTEKWLTPLGKRILRARWERGLSQKQLADDAGISEESVSLLERGAPHLPRPSTLHALATTLGIPPAEMVNLREQTRAFLASEEPEAPAMDLPHLAALGESDGYSRVRRADLPTTGTEGEMYEVAYQIGELNSQRDQGAFSKDDNHKLTKLALRRQVLLGGI